MSALFSPPSVPAEDPAVKAQQDALAKRSEDERIRSLQTQLGGETARDQASQFGTRSLLGPFGMGLTKIRSLLGVG